jgi:serine O-acetyltransferase
VFDALREDWQTYEGDWKRQGLWVLAVYRFGRWRYTVRPAVLRKPLSALYRALKLLMEIVTGIDLPCETQVGRRLRIDHFGGIVISGDAVLGDDVLVRNGVTIGLRRTHEPGAPHLGNRVDIGAGAKLLGRIRIGDDVIIGANAVVLTDVPPRSLAVGVPARVRPRRQGRPPVQSLLDRNDDRNNPAAGESALQKGAFHAVN